MFYKPIINNLNVIVMKLKNIANFLKSKYAKIIAFFILAIALCVSISKCSSYKLRYENAYRNYNDTLQEYVNKYNEAYAMNNAYITDIKTLKSENLDLYNEVKSLRDNPIVVTKIKTEYVTDTITITPVVTADTATGDFTADIDYKDDWNSISGNFKGNIYTSDGIFTLDRLQFDCSLTTDLIERDGKLYFITKSDNPYMKITDVDGYLISPEKSKVLKKQFNRPWGVMIGVGGTASIYNNKFVFLPGINITIGYKILSF